MSKWDLMATPRNAGGAGFTNTRVRNVCLLAKWIVKIERGDNNLCCNLLRNKYLREKGIFGYKKKNGSQFWRGLMSIREEVARGSKYTVGDGKKIRLWEDVWHGGCPLKLTFHNLFEICNQQEWSLHKTLKNDTIKLTFRWNFGFREERQWEALSSILEEVTLDQQQDPVIWVLEKCNNFSTSSLYNAITFPGVENKWMMSIWGANLPLKVKIFLWELCNDKIQSAEQLKKRNWNGPIECKLCGQTESAEHIFVTCAVAKLCRSVVRDALEWARLPTCMEDVIEKLVEGSHKTNRAFVFLFGCLSWSLWLIRNDLVFNDITIASPDVGIFRAISYMQKWRILSKAEDQPGIDATMTKLRLRLSSLRSED